MQHGMFDFAALLRCSGRGRLVLLMLLGGMIATGLNGPLQSAFKPGDAEWPQILGPDRNGISTETNLLDQWPANGPKEVWRIRGGVGMSGLSISRGRLITVVQRDAQQIVVAVDAKTGKSIWEQPVAPQYRNSMGDGPRATPTIAGDQVFIFTGEGILLALSFSDGKILWSHNVLKELDGKEADYGMACSPLVVGTQVIVTAGASKATVIAYDTKTSKQVWAAGNDAAGYSSPALLLVGGQSQVVVYTGGSVMGLDPKSGTNLWRYPYETNYECNIAIPLSVDGQVFISAGENHGSVLLSLKPNGEKFDVSETWTSQGTKSVLRNEWQTSILLDGHLYGMDNVGGAGPITHLTCINATTGQRVWQQLRFGKGNLIEADGKLWITTMKGELVLVRATPKNYEELGRKEIIATTRQAPALAGGLLYLRDDKEIVCLDVRKM
jgi:outer membrane protein assembly factor BamB